jgi:hypothetical protein
MPAAGLDPFPPGIEREIAIEKKPAGSSPWASAKHNAPPGEDDPGLPPLGYFATTA